MRKLIRAFGQILYAISFFVLFFILLGSGALQKPLPGDVELTLWLQNSSLIQNAWNDIRAIGNSASFQDAAQWLAQFDITLSEEGVEHVRKPIFGTAYTIVIALMAGLIVIFTRGWEYVSAPLLAYMGAWLFEDYWQGLLNAPRPDPDLVNVVELSMATGLPSSFGLAMGAIFGCVMSMRSSPPAYAGLVRLGVLSIFVFCALVRVVPGAHWPSQMIISLTIGTLFAGLSLSLTDQILGRGSERSEQ